MLVVPILGFIIPILGFFRRSLSITKSLRKNSLMWGLAHWRNCTQRRTHAVTESQDQVEVVVSNLALDLPTTLRLSCQGFLDNCILAQLIVLKYVFCM
ncbi:hypothetical protein ECAE60S_04396 [Eoetvoesiella caeni]